MLRRYLVTAGLIAAVAMPAAAFAAAKAKTYYAEQSVKTKYCYVVDWKPNGKTATEIGTDSFDSYAKAWAAVKADADCKAPTKMVMKTSAKTTTTTTTTKPVTPPKPK